MQGKLNIYCDNCGKLVAINRIDTAHYAKAIGNNVIQALVSHGFCCSHYLRNKPSWLRRLLRRR